MCEEGIYPARNQRGSHRLLNIFPYGHAAESGSVSGTKQLPLFIL